MPLKAYVMSNAVIFNRIKKDHLFLLKSYAFELSLMLLLITVLFNYPLLNLSLDIHSFALIIPGICFGLITAGFLHNTAHNNIRNSFLNRLVGEFCGWWVLYGYKNFVMIHYLHHIYADEEHDPVNPEGMSFIVFLSAPMRYMIRKTKNWLFEVHGNSDEYKFVMNLQTVIFHLLLVSRLTFWYLLLGKEMFLFFYLPGYISNITIFAHINYICHQEKEDGTIEVMNLNHNLYYRFANVMTSGGYFHKNHHINPRLFNPKRLKSSEIQVSPESHSLV